MLIHIDITTGSRAKASERTRSQRVRYRLSLQESDTFGDCYVLIITNTFKHVPRKNDKPYTRQWVILAMQTPITRKTHLTQITSTPFKRKSTIGCADPMFTTSLATQCKQWFCQTPLMWRHLYRLKYDEGGDSLKNNKRESVILAHQESVWIFFFGYTITKRIFRLPSVILIIRYHKSWQLLSFMACRVIVVNLVILIIRYHTSW